MHSVLVPQQTPRRRQNGATNVTGPVAFKARLHTPMHLEHMQPHVALVLVVLITLVALITCWVAGMRTALLVAIKVLLTLVAKEVEMKSLLVEAAMHGRRADELAVAALELLDVVHKAFVVAQLFAGEKGLGGALVALRHLGRLADVVNVMLATEQGIVEYFSAVRTRSILCHIMPELNRETKIIVKMDSRVLQNLNMISLWCAKQRRFFKRS